jgi:arylsulfatase A-like enzyme
MRLPVLEHLPTRRQVLKAGLATAALAALPNRLHAAVSKDHRPNIVLILADDLRADSLSCAGNPILQTPNIDALAARGVRFTQSFTTTAICMSSRASILTGLHTRVHGIDNFAVPLKRSLFVQSYPMLLRRSGYRTGFVGKWGIGDNWLPRADYDFFAGFTGQGSYFEPGNPAHLTPRQADQAVEFLRSCRANQPFCLAVSFKAPHVQDEGRDKPGIYPKYPYDRALDPLFQDDAIPRPVTADITPSPPFLKQSINCTREAKDFLPDDYEETMRDLYRLITGLDQAVGTITAELQRLGFADNTVVIFSSDHGSFYGEHGFGGKWLMHEEAIRTPMIIADPRGPASQFGTTRGEMVLNLDLPATILNLANIDAPAGMQGRSLLPLVAGKTVDWRRELFYENRFPNTKKQPIAPTTGIRTADWKYIRYLDEDPVYEQLFDLRADPREERNLAGDGKYRTVLDTLWHRWGVWDASLDRHSAGRRWVDPV